MAEDEHVTFRFLNFNIDCGKNGILILLYHFKSSIFPPFFCRQKDDVLAVPYLYLHLRQRNVMIIAYSPNLLVPLPLSDEFFRVKN